MEERQDDRPDDRQAPEDRPEEPGAEGGSGSESADKLPALPAEEDDSPVGDTDQHSGA